MKINKNYIFIILLGIVGMCFGLLDWDGVIADILYLKYDDKLMISIVAASISAMKIIATLICIRLTQAKRTNLVFYISMITSSITAILSAIFFENDLVVFFCIFYLLNTLIMEIFSGYHYAFAHNSLPEEQALGAHSKRISLFKVMYAVGVAVAGILSVNLIQNALYVIGILVVVIFVIAIIFTSQVKNNNKQQIETEKKSYAKSINIFKYSAHMKMCLVIRFLGKFALTSLVTLVSVKLIDDSQSYEILKLVKSLLWVISGIGFFCSSYFIRKKKTVYYDFFIKVCIIILLPFIFIEPTIGFALVIFKGISEPFNTMSNFEMLRLNQEKTCDLPQQELMINLFGFFSGMLSSFILINVDFILAIILTCLTLGVSAILEIILYRKKIKNTNDNCSCEENA